MSFPNQNPKGASSEIWSKSPNSKASEIYKLESVKITDNNNLQYFKLILWAFGSGEQKKQKLSIKNRTPMKLMSQESLFVFYALTFFSSSFSLQQFFSSSFYMIMDSSL